MAKPGLPKKYAKMGFKKGWAAFKRAKASLSRKLKRSKPKTPKKKPSNTSTRRAVAKRAPQTAPKKGGTKKMAKTTFNWKRNKVILAAANGATVSAGVIIPPILLETTPVVKDWNQWGKVGIQFGAGGLTWLLARNPWVKMFGVGFIGSGFITLALPWIRERGFKVFGPKNMGRNGQLTPAELAQLRLNAQGMDGPMNKVYGPVNKVQGPLSLINDGRISYMSGRSRFSAGNFRSPRG